MTSKCSKNKKVVTDVLCILSYRFENAKPIGPYIRYAVSIYWWTAKQSVFLCILFKYARAVKQKVWNEAENRERDWGETLFFLSPHTPVRRVRLARFARVRLLLHVSPISSLILRKKPTVLQSIYWREFNWPLRKFLT